jgi:hypothetical protein
MSSPDSDLPADPQADVGNPAQSDRRKELKFAKVVLLVVGGLTILAGLAALVKYRADIDTELGKRFDREIAKQERETGIVFVPGMKTQWIAENRPAAERYLNIFCGSGIALGVVFVLLGLGIHLAPVPITAAAFVLYIVAQAIYVYIGSLPLSRGAIVVKVFITFAMFLALHAAIVYRREVNRTPRAAYPDV